MNMFFKRFRLGFVNLYSYTTCIDEMNIIIKAMGLLLYGLNCSGKTNGEAMQRSCECVLGSCLCYCDCTRF